EHPFAERRKSMLAFHAEGASLPVLTNLVKHRRDDPEQNVDRPDARFDRVVDRAFRRPQIVAATRREELALDVFQEYRVSKIGCGQAAPRPAFPANSMRDDEILVVRNLSHELLAVGTPFQHHDPFSDQ
ncbi:MAG: hypothetical protein WCB02_38935, partial [Bradyrhizobium sp.]